MSAEARTPALDAEAALQAAAALLTELRDGHRRLEARATHVEAELCRANDELAVKLDELERMTRSLEAVLASIPTGVVVYDESARIARVNSAAAEMLGVTEAMLLGAQDAPGLAGPKADGRRADVECLDGRARVLARRYSSVVLTDGSRFGGVEVLDDQTELARAEERMRRLTRAAALGTMVGGVAHEVRNPLHAISGFAELLQREVAPESRAARHAERIRAGVADLEAIVASMLNAAGHGQLALEHAAVRPIVQAAVAAVLAERDGAGDAGRHVVTIECADLIATFDAIELRQALRNLVANACDVQSDGGRVAIEVRAEAGRDLVVIVDDAGPGIASGAREHLFDPFFTTRAAGTGLGLALVARVAELHGGSIELSPGPGALGGARFVLRLPDALAAPLGGAPDSTISTISTTSTATTPTRAVAADIDSPKTAQ